MTAAPNRRPNSNVVFATLDTRGCTALGALQKLSLAPKHLFLRQAGHRGGMLLRAPRTFEPPCCYMWHVKILHWCFQALCCLPWTFRLRQSPCLLISSPFALILAQFHSPKRMNPCHRGLFYISRTSVGIWRPCTQKCLSFMAARAFCACNWPITDKQFPMRYSYLLQ